MPISISCESIECLQKVTNSQSRAKKKTNSRFHSCCGVLRKTGKKKRKDVCMSFVCGRQFSLIYKTLPLYRYMFFSILCVSLATTHTHIKSFIIITSQSIRMCVCVCVNKLYTDE